jgi:hypothetical protein
MLDFVNENINLGSKSVKIHDIARFFESLKIFNINFFGRKFFISCENFRKIVV